MVYEKGNMFSKSVVLLFCAITCYGEQLYKGYKIYEVTPQTKDQLNELGLFSEQHAEYDFLNDVLMINGTARIVTSPLNAEHLETFLHHKSLLFKIVNNDLSEAINDSMSDENVRVPRAIQKLSFSKYHRHSAINTYLEKLAKLYPQRVTVEHIGDSFQGKKMKVIRISYGLHDRLQPKKTIFIDAGIHGREWIAPSTALYVIYQLVENQDANRELLLGYDWIILPVANPDGYEYTFSNKRLWRKTRSSNSNKKCSGTDANRNFAHKWGLGKDVLDECSDIYPGSESFSEVETQHLRDFILSIKHNCKLYISLHSFGRFIFYPWSWDTSFVTNFKEQHAVALAGQRAANEEFGTMYQVGSPARIFKKISGAAMDWVYAMARIPVAITIELPAGGNGFDPPPKDILNMVKEGWAVIKAMGKETKSLFR